MKKTYILPIAILIAVFSIYLVSAAVSMATPIQGGNYSATITFNCTGSTLGGSDPNLLNVTIYYNSTGGFANRTDGSGVLTSVKNTSDVEYYGSVSISSLGDASTYNVTCFFYNGTNPSGVPVDEELAGGAIITVDNTACVGDATFSESKVDYGRSFTYNTSLTDALSGVQTSSCQILDPNGDYVGSVTTSDSSKVFTDTTRKDGIWNITCNGTDYAGNTCAFSDTLTVNALGRAVTTQPTSPISGKIQTTIEGIEEKLKGVDKMVWVVLGIIALVVLASNKKR